MNSKVNIRKAAALLLIAGGLLSCSDDNGGGEYIPPDSGVVFVLGGESGSTDTASLSFSSPWQVAVQPDGFEVTPASGDAGDVVMTVTSPASNPRVGEAEASFTVTDGSTESVYRIIQKGTPQLRIVSESLSVPSKASQAEIVLDGNIPFEVTVAETDSWIELGNVTASESVLLSDGETYSDSLRYTVPVTVLSNESGVERTASVTFTTEAGKYIVEIVQAAPLQVDWNRDFFRGTAILRFTATWCYNCPLMNKAIYAVAERMPGRIAAMNMHAISSEGGLAYWESGDYEEVYGIPGYPTGIANNMAMINNSRSLDELEAFVEGIVDEAVASYPAHVGISAYSQMTEDGGVRVDMSIAVKETSEYKVCVFLLENGLVYPQEDYTDGLVEDYVHNGVVRAVLTDDIFGDPLSLVEAQSVIEYSVEADIPRSVLDPANLSVVIAVVRPGSPEVQGVPGIQYLDLGYIYDNVVSLPADGFVELRYEE